MKKLFIGFIIFVVTGLASAFLGSPGEATFVIGGICALLYFIFSPKKSGSTSRGTSQKASLSSSGSSSVNNRIYAKKYSSEGVARLLASGNLYACRFEDGSNRTRIDVVTPARITYRNGSHYIELPEWKGGKYKLEHNYSHAFKAGCMWMNEGGDNYYLMDQNKNLILY